MKTQMMIDAVCDEIKQNLNAFCEHADFEHLTPEVAEQMSQAFGEALAAGGVAGYRTFLEQYECEADTIVRGEQTLRVKMVSEKVFMTPFGKMTLNRKVYQADRGGQCHVPLDAAWGMEQQFA